MAVDSVFLALSIFALAASLWATLRTKQRNLSVAPSAYRGATISLLCAWGGTLIRAAGRIGAPEAELIPIALASTFFFTSAALGYVRYRATKAREEVVHEA